MILLQKLRRRFLALFAKRKLDSDMDAEMRSHIEMRTAEYIGNGMKPEDARQAALRQFGWTESIKETCRAQRGVSWIDDFLQDTRFGIRQLIKYPAFTAIAVLTLALGIGANASLFAALDTILFRPLPARDADRLVFLIKGKEELFSFPSFERFRQGVHSITNWSVSQYRTQGREFSSSQGAESIEVASQGVSGQFFETLGIPPQLGRAIVPDDDKIDAPEHVAVISHAFWARNFAADPGVIGRTVRFENTQVSIIGVMPPDFVGFQMDVRPDLWFPLQLTREIGRRDRNPFAEGVQFLLVCGRLCDGVTREQAQAEVSTFFQAQLDREVAASQNRPPAELQRILSQKITVHSGHAGFVGARSEFRQPLTLLMVAAAMALLIACVNIAGLLLARGAAREKEFALRAAIGARRGRILRQLTTESLLLALTGGALGLLFARWSAQFLSNFLAQSNTPAAIAPDGRALTFTILISLATALIFGLMPAWRFSRPDLFTAFRTQSGDHRGRLQPLLVMLQVALTALLLAGAGLFARTLSNLRGLDFGFQSQNLVALAIDPGPPRTNGFNVELLLRQVLSELQTLPGVSNVSLGGAGLLTGNGISMDVIIDGYTPASGEEMRASAVLGGPKFFQTMGVPLLRGRDFTPLDEPNPDPSGQPTQAKVTVIGSALAAKYFGDADPIGKRLTIDGQQRKVELEIIGVAKDSKYSPNLRQSPPMEFYIPYFGSGIRMPPTFYLRTDHDTVAQAETIRRLLARIDPQLKIRTLRSMTEVIDRLLIRERIVAQLLGFFSAFALLLACLGIYGILSFQVARRTQEIGVRMALGATARSVITMILRRGLFLVACGGAAGLAIALATTKFIASFLYDVSPIDPINFATVAALLLAACALASWLPARRAAKLNPMTALRYD